MAPTIAPVRAFAIAAVLAGAALTTVPPVAAAGVCKEQTHPSHGECQNSGKQECTPSEDKAPAPGICYTQQSDVTFSCHCLATKPGGGGGGGGGGKTGGGVGPGLGGVAVLVTLIGGSWLYSRRRRNG
jgi:hypothetical protein